MKRLLEGQQLQRTVPPTAGRVEPVVHLPGGLTLDDRSCWQYPTMLVGNVGSGQSTLMEQIRRPCWPTQTACRTPSSSLRPSRMCCAAAAPATR